MHFCSKTCKQSKRKNYQESLKGQIHNEISFSFHSFNKYFDGSHYVPETGTDSLRELTFKTGGEKSLPFINI